MKRYITLIILSLVMVIPDFAFGSPVSDGDNNEALKREQWFKEFRAKKHEFLAKQLSLTNEQKEPFFAIYDRLEDEMKTINDQTRDIERRVSTKKDATDAEYDAAIDALYNQRYREWTAESKAREELSKILSKKQLLKIKYAEMKFTRALMKQHQQSQEKKGQQFDKKKHKGN